VEVVEILMEAGEDGKEERMKRGKNGE